MSWTPERAVIDPDDLLGGLVSSDPALNVERYWGERSIFYNPGRERALGIIWVSIKDHDGENDRSSDLDREGVYRLSFQLPAEDYERRFGARPERPPKGGVVGIPGYDPTQLDRLVPHPVYAWMNWVMILSPTPAQLEALRPALMQSLEVVRRKWRR
jgi:Family of unknown function (DUF6194)